LYLNCEKEVYAHPKQDKLVKYYSKMIKKLRNCLQKISKMRDD